MKLPIFTLAVLGLLIIGATLSDWYLGTNFGGRTVSEYEATFVPISTAKGDLVNGQLETTLRITYNIGIIPEIRGHKRIGRAKVKELVVTDGDGKPVNSYELSLHVTGDDQITWTHSPKWMGKQTIVAKFVQERAGIDSLDNAEMVYFATWPGQFTESARNGTYTLVLPPGPNPGKIYTFPGEGSLSQGKQGLQVAFHEDVISGSPILFGTGAFVPAAQKIRDTSPSIAANEQARLEPPRDDYGWVCGSLLIGLFLINLLILLAWKRGHARVLTHDPRSLGRLPFS